MARSKTEIHESASLINNTTDRLMDTDADGLDDRFEIFEGWSVNIAGQGERPVFSSPSLRDTDRDGLTDMDEAIGAWFDRRGRSIGLADANDNQLTLKKDIRNEEVVSLQDAMLKLNLSQLDVNTLRSNAPSVDVDDDTIFVGGVKGLSTGDKVTYAHGGGTVIGGLASGTDYFAINVGDGKIQLALTKAKATSIPPTPISLSGLGTGHAHTITLVDTNTTIAFDPHPRIIFDSGSNRELRLRIVDPGSALLATLKVGDLATLESGVIVPEEPLELVDVVGLMSGIEAELTVKDTGTVLPLRMVYNAKTWVTELGGVTTPSTTTGASIDAHGVVRLATESNDLILVNIFGKKVELADARRALIAELRPTASAEIVLSDPNNPDTDGLLDGEEFEIKTDPGGRLIDFNGDGNLDYNVFMSPVVDGYVVDILATDYSVRVLPGGVVEIDANGDGSVDGIVNVLFPRAISEHEISGGDSFSVTDPTDADADNDKLSDGEEAELKDVEANRWVVRPEDSLPKRTYSDPLQADADFDGLVDGDEKYISDEGVAFELDKDGRRVGKTSDPTGTDPRGTDPKNADSDGDSRLDGTEVELGLNPLKAALAAQVLDVTVVFDRIVIEDSGDCVDDGIFDIDNVAYRQVLDAGYHSCDDPNKGGFNPGEFGFDLAVRRPGKGGGLRREVVVSRSPRCEAPGRLSVCRSRSQRPIPEWQRQQGHGVGGRSSE